MVDTAAYFSQGYLSQGNYLAAPAESRGVIVSMPDSVNYTFADSLTPSSGCPAYKGGDTSSKATDFRATYQGQIAARLNHYLDGLTLTASDVGVMQDLCGFQAEVNGDTRFCDIFEGAVTISMGQISTSGDGVSRLPLLNRRGMERLRVCP